MLLLCIALLLQQCIVFGFTKVWVPAVQDAWMTEARPAWHIDKRIQARYNYTTFVYQTFRPELPNYINRTRGAENSVYFKYIVDHYDNFPDVAIFTQPHPFETQPKLLEMVGCISPNATFMTLETQQGCSNTMSYTIKRYCEYCGMWGEQCMRDVLDIVWDTKGDAEALNKRIGYANRPIAYCFISGHQFIVSRAVIHKYPLSVWQRLYKILSQDVGCHQGEPDYEHLGAYHMGPMAGKKVGPEPADIGYDIIGRTIQQGTADRLNHVIFGGMGLDMDYPGKGQKCQNFLPNCPGSPCDDK